LRLPPAPTPPYPLSTPLSSCSSSGPHRALHSFPTRRSSDLEGGTSSFLGLLSALGLVVSFGLAASAFLLAVLGLALPPKRCSPTRSTYSSGSSSPAKKVTGKDPTPVRSVTLALRIFPMVMPLALPEG